MSGLGSLTRAEEPRDKPAPARDSAAFSLWEAKPFGLPFLKRRRIQLERKLSRTRAVEPRAPRVKALAV
jgi:hypothetical protein